MNIRFIPKYLRIAMTKRTWKICIINRKYSSPNTGAATVWQLLVPSLRIHTKRFYISCRLASRIADLEVVRAEDRRKNVLDPYTTSMHRGSTCPDPAQTLRSDQYQDLHPC